MISDSTVYTVGTALKGAQQTGAEIDVRVDGAWLSGRVQAVDGHGLVLDGPGATISVIRLEHVSAITIGSPLPDTESDIDQRLPALPRP